MREAQQQQQQQQQKNCVIVAEVVLQEVAVGKSNLKRIGDSKINDPN